MRPSLHPNFKYHIESIGNEKQPLLIIDNYLNDAETLIEQALNANNPNLDPGYYPGLRVPTPDLYNVLLNELLEPLLCDTFTIEPSEIAVSESYYSLVCKPQSQLEPVQQVPHFDHPSRNELAAVHYLCGPPHGGTSFYRHKTTGFESIDEERSGSYLETLVKEIQQKGLPTPPAYINGSTDIFERIASVEAVFNRMVIYRCSSLHSGNIPKDYAFDLNPRTGRFTITSFMHK